MKILLFGRVLDLIISLLTAVIITFFVGIILPETLPAYFSMPLGMILGSIAGVFCGLMFALINVMFSHAIHTMSIGMFSGMMASGPAGYTLSLIFAFAVWLLLLVSDEYFSRILNKTEFELSEN